MCRPSSQFTVVPSRIKETEFLARSLCSPSKDLAMEEYFKDVKGYEGRYKISNYGRILSYKRSKAHFLSLGLNKNTYVTVTLHKNKEQKNHRVHILVAKAFLPKSNHKVEVNHINEIKSDNRVENLEWMTHKENCRYGTIIERASKRNSKPVKQLTLDGNLVKIWPSAKKASENGYTNQAITACCRRDIGYKTHKGYKWELVNGLNKEII